MSPESRNQKQSRSFYFGTQDKHIHIRWGSFADIKLSFSFARSVSTCTSQSVHCFRTIYEKETETQHTNDIGNTFEYCKSYIGVHFRSFGTFCCNNATLIQGFKEVHAAFRILQRHLNTPRHWLYTDEGYTVLCVALEIWREFVSSRVSGPWTQVAGWRGFPDDLP